MDVSQHTREVEYSHRELTKCHAHENISIADKHRKLFEADLSVAV